MVVSSGEPTPGTGGGFAQFSGTSAIPLPGLRKPVCTVGRDGYPCMWSVDAGLGVVVKRARR